MTMSEQAPNPDAVGSVELRVRYAETDQMGVVYHANYLVWCEVGRTDLIRRRYMSYAELERRGILLAVADASLRYHAPARYEDLVRVDTWVSAIRSRTITFEYRIFRMENDRRAERLVSASTTLIVIDRDSRPRKLPPDLMAALAPESPT
jgi:acyl-CoA thioester hydrolase